MEILALMHKQYGPDSSKEPKQSRLSAVKSQRLPPTTTLSATSTRADMNLSAETTWLYQTTQAQAVPQQPQPLVVPTTLA